MHYPTPTGLSALTPCTPANTIGMRMGIAIFELFVKIVRETGSREASRIATTHRLLAFA